MFHSVNKVTNEVVCDCKAMPHIINSECVNARRVCDCCESVVRV